jgi:hypothetical protein
VKVPALSVGVALLYPSTGPILDESRSHICVVVKDDNANGDNYILDLAG